MIAVSPKAASERFMFTYFLPYCVPEKSEKLQIF